jgi:hypothetical protein
MAKPGSASLAAALQKIDDLGNLPEIRAQSYCRNGAIEILL